MWCIKEIEAITEEQAAAMAEEMMEIKGHNVYFVEFEGAFGYSALVFCEGAHIYYANDYALHHGRMERAELKRLCELKLNSSPFTETGLAEPCASYQEWVAKRRFLTNWYGQRRPHVSAFYIGERPNTDGMVYCPVTFAWYDDREFVMKCIELRTKLEMSVGDVDNYEFWEGAFLYEMRNHEYGINWQGDYDVISCFAHIKYSDSKYAEDYLADTNFSETQKRAYMGARKKYFTSYEE